VRSRAIELKDWCMADGAADYAFVHATLKIGAGRPREVRQRTGDALFEMMKTHFAELHARRYLALSLEIYEFDEAGTWKHNNVHARFRKGPA
jgi:5-carboxymethyl-2-hydroxymuconate isomerase